MTYEQTLSDLTEAMREPAVSTNCSGRTVAMIDREQALAHFYAAERRAGADPLLANERMHFFAKRLDDLEVIRQCMERTR